MERRGAKKQDIILAGVGGQGILSIAYVIDHAALEEGWNMKQAEIHGMAQRGGTVQSHLRLSSRPIYSDLIPRGGADMILSVEPLEAVRYLDSLSPSGVVVSSSNPLRNISDYPDVEQTLDRLRRVPRHVIVDSEKLAKEAGSSRAQNMVMLGAASPFLPLREETLLQHIESLFQSRGENMVFMNIKAFRLGRQAASF